LGRALLALFLPFGGAVSAETLIATRSDGVVIARFPMPEGAGWCIHWRHSVQLFEVKDCYENRGGKLVLDRSHLPDFAAGLDHIPGRGRQVSDGQGGYWILDLNEPVPGNAYVLRPGSLKVDHRIVTPHAEVSLSAAATHDRVRIALTPDQDP
jgi:hypothetical protein